MFLRTRIKLLENRVVQLECTHDFKFKESFDPSWGERQYCIFLRCSHCGKTKRKFWRYFTKKEQQAFKLLNLVPEDWGVKA